MPLPRNVRPPHGALTIGPAQGQRCDFADSREVPTSAFRGEHPAATDGLRWLWRLFASAASAGSALPPKAESSHAASGDRVAEVVRKVAPMSSEVRS